MIYIKLITLQIFWYLAIKFGGVIYFPVAALFIFFTDYLIFTKKLSSIKIKKYFIFSIMLILLGFLMDQFFHFMKIVTWGEQLYPFELLSVWIIFPCYYQQFASKLSSRLYLAFLCGCIFGPFAYYSGANISEVINCKTGIYPMLLMSVVWGVGFLVSLKGFQKVVR
jgi:hypothetical protein